MQASTRSLIPPGAQDYLTRSLQSEKSRALHTQQHAWQAETGNTDQKMKPRPMPMWKRIAAILAPALHPVCRCFYLCNLTIQADDLKILVWRDLVCCIVCIMSSIVQHSHWSDRQAPWKRQTQLSILLKLVTQGASILARNCFNVTRCPISRMKFACYKSLIEDGITMALQPQDGELILSFLQARAGVMLRASVLLSGPVGSGKRTAIFKAAEELGLRAIPFSCQELRTGLDSKTALALKMGFDEAKMFAPALIILSDLESLIEKNPAASGENEYKTEWQANVQYIGSLAPHFYKTTRYWNTSIWLLDTAFWQQSLQAVIVVMCSTAWYRKSQYSYGNEASSIHCKGLISYNHNVVQASRPATLSFEWQPPIEWSWLQNLYIIWFQVR